MSSSKSVTTKVTSTKTTRIGGGTTTTTTKTASKVQAKHTPKKKEDVGQQTSYFDLLEQLKGTGKLWEDPDFPADTSSVFVSKASKGYREFVWKRPKDICKNPQLFADGVSRFDVQQGALGDCWLLAVVASLSLYEPIFKNVVPTDQDFDKNYIGAFRFRFWRFGKWVEVVVDDRLPTYGGKLVFMHSADNNEFWSALLEKAYAKMCGIYESLSGGSQIEAMEDFTGGLCETIKLNEKERPVGLYNQMLKFAKQSTLMGCAIESAKIEGVMANGLISGHAYSITDVQKVKQTDGTVVELVRVRNPWGNEKEWKGKWSDSSPEWETISKSEKERLCSNFANDGEFWMTFDDFAKNFTKIEICHLGPESLNEDLSGKRRWEMCIEDGSWCKNINAGGCRNFIDSFVTNPQFRVEVVDPDDEDSENTGTVIIGLMQKDMRQRNLGFLVIGYVIYKLKDPNCGLLNKSFFKFSTTIAKSPGFINQREVCGRHKLPTGHYVIIPSTFNPNEEANFMLRIFSEKPNKTDTLDIKNGKTNIAKHLRDTDDVDESTLTWLFEIKPELDYTLCNSNYAKDPFEDSNSTESIKSLNILHRGCHKQVSDQPVSEESKVKNEKLVALEKELEKLFNDMAGPMEVINACQLRDILNAILVKDIKNFKGFDLELCRSLVALEDYDHTGKMEFKDFMKIWKDIKVWKTAFKDFDCDGNGVFDCFEFRNALINVGLSVSNALFKVVANRYIDPEKGVITFEDFIMAVIRLTNAFETMELQPEDDEGNYVFTADEFLESFLYM